MFWAALALFSLAPGGRAQSTNVPAQLAPDVFRVGLLQQPGLTESSGLAASRRYPGVFWTHNDTGNPSFLFAINHRGDHLGAFEVKGGNLIDWEALAFDEAGNLYLADVGTNGMARSHSAIHRAPEPDPAGRWGPARIDRTWYIRFPGEREDCESFFVHDGYGYLVSKYETDNLVNLYRFSLADSSTSVLLEFVTKIPVNGDVSDATISPDKMRLALVTDRDVEVLFINGDPASADAVPRESTRFDNSSMEGGAFVEDGILVTSDSIRDVLLFTSSRLQGAPEFTTALTNIASFVGRSVTLAVEVFGFPAPTFEWRFNGQIIPGATNAALTLADLTFTSAGLYEVTAVNPAGVARSRAMLTVSERIADLRITEVMSLPVDGTEPTADWWELTSFDTETNDLSGWRFNDNTGGLIDAFVIPEGTRIQPGESIIFVETLDANQFRAWWGEANVPASVQVVTFTGAELSFSSVGDSLRFWDNVATNPGAVAAQVSFGPAEAGVSFTVNPATGEFGAKSQMGVNGAFRAISGPNIGSPGLFAANATFRLEGQLQGSSVQLSFQGPPGVTYVLESCENLAAGDWTSTGEVFQTTNAAAIFLQEQGESPRRFYRVRAQ